jgi:hypothetical protein
VTGKFITASTDELNSADIAKFYADLFATDLAALTKMSGEQLVKMIDFPLPALRSFSPCRAVKLVGWPFLKSARASSFASTQARMPRASYARFSTVVLALSSAWNMALETTLQLSPLSRLLTRKARPAR